MSGDIPSKEIDQANQTTANLLRGLGDNPHEDGGKEPHGENALQNQFVSERGGILLALGPQDPGNKPTLTEYKTKLDAANTQFLKDYTSLQTNGNEDTLYKHLETGLKSRVEGMLIKDDRGNITGTVLPGISAQSFTRSAENAKGNYAEGSLAYNAAILLDISKKLMSKNPELAKSLILKDPKLENNSSISTCIIAILGTHIDNQTLLSTDVDQALNNKNTTDPAIVQASFTKKGLSYLAGQALSADSKVLPLLGQSFQNLSANFYDPVNKTNDAAHTAIVDLLNQTITNSEAKSLQERCIAAKIASDKAKETKQPDSKPAGQRDANGHLEPKPEKPQPATPPRPTGFKLDDMKPEEIKHQQLRTAPTEEIVGLNRKYNQVIYDALVESVPKYWFWNKVETFTPDDQATFTSALKTADGKDRSPQDLEKIYRRYQRAYNDSQVAPDDEKIPGRIYRFLDTHLGDGAGAAVYTVATVVGTIWAGTKGIKWLAKKRTETEEGLKELRGKGGDKSSKPKFKAKDEVGVITHIEEAMKAGKLSKYEQVASRLNGWKHDMAHTDGQQAAFDSVAHEINARAAEARENGGRQGDVSVKDYLKTRREAAERKVAQGEKGSSKPGDSVPEGDDKEKETKELTPEQKDAADKEAMKRGIMLNLLRSGHERGLPITFAEGKEAVVRYLEDYEAVFKESASEAQKEGFDDLKDEISILPDTVIMSEYLVGQLEPHQTTLSNFRTNALALLSGKGIDINARKDKDEAPFKKAAAQLQILVDGMTISNEAKACIEERVINPLSPLNPSFKEKDTTASIGELLTKGTTTSVDSTLATLKITQPQETAMWERHYRKALQSKLETDGNAYKKDGGTFLAVEKDIDQLIVDNGGSTTRKDALNKIKADLIEAGRPIAECKAEIEQLKLEMRKCLNDPNDSKSGVKAADRGYYDDCEAEKIDLEKRLAQLEKARPKPAEDDKDKDKGKKKELADEGKTISEALAGKLPNPHQITVIREVANKAGRAEISLRVGSGMDPKVESVTIKYTESGKTPENLGLVEFKERMMNSYTTAGKTADAEAIRDLTPNQFKEALTDAARFLDLETMEIRGQTVDAGGRKMIGGAKPGTTGRVLVLKWVLGTGLSVLGAAAAVNQLQQQNQPRQFDLGEGLSTGPSF